MRIPLLNRKSIRSIALKHFLRKYEAPALPDPNKDPLDFSDEELLIAIKNAKEEMDQAMENFNYAESFEIIDCCIYRIKASTEYYQYLIKIAKKKNLATTYIPYRLKKSKGKEENKN